MCLGVPGRVVRVDGDEATVDFWGVTRTVRLELVDQPVTSFGWRRPFTPSGEAFVRQLCPEGFWVPD